MRLGRYGAVAAWAWALGCGDPVDAPLPQTDCVGGGSPVVVAGAQDGSAFHPFDSDDAVPVVDAAGTWALQVDYQIGGVDPTEPVTAVIRVRFGTDPSDDYLASVWLRCEGEGPATFRAVAPLDRFSDVAALHGEAFALTSVFTDARGVTGEQSLTLVVDASDVSR